MQIYLSVVYLCPYLKRFSFRFKFVFLLQHIKNFQGIGSKIVQVHKAWNFGIKIKIPATKISENNLNQTWTFNLWNTSCFCRPMSRLSGLVLDWPIIWSKRQTIIKYNTGDSWRSLRLRYLLKSQLRLNLDCQITR